MRLVYCFTLEIKLQSESAFLSGVPFLVINSPKIQRYTRRQTWGGNFNAYSTIIELGLNRKSSLDDVVAMHSRGQTARSGRVEALRISPRVVLAACKHAEVSLPHVSGREVLKRSFQRGLK